MATSVARPVIFLPGGIMPAAAQYAPLLSVLKHEVQPVLKDLEVYAADAPAPGYRLDHEVEGLSLLADAVGYDSFHLVGYSGGGAVALAFVAAYPQRVRSLALSEPAVIPSPEWLRAEHEYMQAVEQAMSLPPAEQMGAFMRANLRPGVALPPPPAGDPPPWMAKRPAGLKAMVQAFAAAQVDLGQFRRFHRPVYLAVGRLSNPVEERKAQALAGLFPDCKVEIYEERHHFDPPQRAEPQRFASALLDLWARAEQAA